MYIKKNNNYMLRSFEVNRFCQIGKLTTFTGYLAWIVTPNWVPKIALHWKAAPNTVLYVTLYNVMELCLGLRVNSIRK